MKGRDSLFLIFVVIVLIATGVGSFLIGSRVKPLIGTFWCVLLGLVPIFIGVGYAELLKKFHKEEPQRGSAFTTIFLAICLATYFGVTLNVFLP